MVVLLAKGALACLFTAFLPSAQVNLGDDVLVTHEEEDSPMRVLEMFEDVDVSFRDALSGTMTACELAILAIGDP
jgi:hypothetical protein